MLQYSGNVRQWVDVAAAHFAGVVAAVSSDVKKRMEDNMRAARDQADCFRELGRLVDPQPQLGTDELERLAKTPGFPHLAATILRLASLADIVARLFRDFMKDHGALLDAQTVKALDAFWVWIAAEPERILAYVPTYRDELEKSVIAGVEEDAAMASEWAVVDADGLDDDE